MEAPGVPSGKELRLRGRGAQFRSPNFLRLRLENLDVIGMLIGEYKHTIDAKKRLAIPAKLRREIGEGAVLTRGLDSSLALYPAKEWEKMVEKISNLPSGKIDARGFSRIILAGAITAELDSLGRILIPDYLKNYAGLKRNVVIAGVHNRLEIWDEEKWDLYKKKVESEVGNMAERLGELWI